MVLLAGSAAPTSAANLVLNPAFDGGTSDWSPINGASFAIAPGAGQPAPAAQITSTATTPSAVVQCVDISGQAVAENYRFSVDFQQVSYQSTGNTVGARFTWNDAADCTGSDLGNVFRGGGFTTPQGTWGNSFSDNNQAPIGANSVRVEAGEIFGAQDGRVTYIDNVIVGPMNTPVELLTFSVD